MFGRGRINDGVRDEAKLLALAATDNGARQTEKRDAAEAAAALGFTLRDDTK